MQRIVVVGPPGAGKSTLAAALAERFDLPHVELDGLWWERDWQEAGREVFCDRAAAVTAGDRWVVDGNYYSNGARDVVWPCADTIIWLDHPRRVTIPRVIRRTIGRALRGTDLWDTGNRESLGRSLGRDSIVRFAWRAHPNYGRRYVGIDEEPDLAHVTVLRLRGPTAVRRWLRSLEE